MKRDNKAVRKRKLSLATNTIRALATTSLVHAVGGGTAVTECLVNGCESD